MEAFLLGKFISSSLLSLLPLAWQLPLKSLLILSSGLQKILIAHVLRCLLCQLLALLMAWQLLLQSLMLFRPLVRLLQEEIRVLFSWNSLSFD